MQPGTGSHLQYRAFRKHGLIKDGLCSRKDNVIWGTHKNPSFASWGSAPVVLISFLNIFRKDSKLAKIYLWVFLIHQRGVKIFILND